MGYKVRVIAYDWRWVSRGDVPVTELVEVWNISTQPTFYLLIFITTFRIFRKQQQFFAPEDGAPHHLEKTHKPQFLPQTEEFLKL
ncbi:hypothetical protein Dacsa_3124 [Dactylococcopsis salina PCC 8305]|uniref:Uncharacterized protein n=1 Tax=Dactylococcopsis salina (strain PCC 8305) TaxID=13035 RepID=K9YYU1_DACS8|nr:hypothetical protein Dacsa_3124 [Dactylococcopsis salina PCC 8305]